MGTPDQIQYCRHVVESALVGLCPHPALRKETEQLIRLVISADLAQSTGDGSGATLLRDSAQFKCATLYGETASYASGIISKMCSMLEETLLQIKLVTEADFRFILDCRKGCFVERLVHEFVLSARTTEIAAYRQMKSDRRRDFIKTTLVGTLILTATWCGVLFSLAGGNIWLDDHLHLGTRILEACGLTSFLIASFVTLFTLRVIVKRWKRRQQAILVQFNQTLAEAAERANQPSDAHRVE